MSPNYSYSAKVYIVTKFRQFVTTICFYCFFLPFDFGTAILRTMSSVHYIEMANKLHKAEQLGHSASEIVFNLSKLYGPMISGAALWRLLGYRTAAAFRQADKRGSLPVPTFSIPHRKSRHAWTKDVSAWLTKLDAETQQSTSKCRQDSATNPTPEDVTR